MIGRGIVKVTLEFDVVGIANQELLDHLAKQLEIQFQNMEAEGTVTPDTDDFSYTGVELTNVDSELIGIVV